MMILSVSSWLVKISGQGMTRPLVISTGSPSPVINQQGVFMIKAVNEIFVIL